ncbi:SdpI family protein [Tuberibacillus calidus]|uniref:SdpI family protein n=1 Tax=Tuberibacillus calidus TaxID=340097 RepID=UPI00040D43C6|nr:SdpI family protein [Tuberibacillus calidus]
MEKMTLTTLIFVCVSILMGVMAYPFLPDTLVIQVGPDNAPSNTAPKLIALAISPISMIILLVSRKSSSKFIHGSNLLDINLVYYTGLIAILGVQVIVILLGLGFTINISLIANVSIGVIFIIGGNFLYRAKKNFVYGIKTRWTLSSTEVWTKTHRFAAAVFVIIGFTVIFMALFNFYTKYTPALFAAGVVMCYVASYVYYRRYQNN